jgi:hypothetical protein
VCAEIAPSPEPEPEQCPRCHFDFRSVRGTYGDVIGIYGLRLGYLIGYKCPHCTHEWPVGYLTRTTNP